MLKFLSKDRHNAVALDRMKRKEMEATGEYKRVQKLRQALGVNNRLSDNYEPLEKLETLQRKHSNNHLVDMLALQASKLDLKRDILAIVDDVIDSVIQCDLDLLLNEFTKISVDKEEEVECVAVHEPKKLPNFESKSNHEFRSWYEKAKIIFFCLHSKLGNGDKALTSKVFDLPPATLRTWMHNKSYFAKWLSFVKTMKLQEVLDYIPVKARKALVCDAADMVDLESGSLADLQKYETHPSEKLILVATKCKTPGIPSTQKKVDHLNNSQLHSREIAKTFSKCGLDPHDTDNILFEKHLEKMCLVDLYNSLIQNQRSEVLA
jgi:hypothetical protein